MLLAGLLLGLLVQQPDSGQVLYRSWCSSCHGASGLGESRASTRLEVPATPLAECAISSAEPEQTWIGIVRDGGEAYGLSLDMPAFGDNASEEQIALILRYIRTLCPERGWPPGDLNFPRPFVAEKAFPENEVVLQAYDTQQKFIYERRIGPRLQFEGVARTNADGGDFFESATAAVKYNVFHDIRRNVIASLGLELTPPIGRQEELELEPFLSFGVRPVPALVVQGEALGVFEDGYAGSVFSLGFGHEMGRFVPMIEGEWSIPHGGPQEFSLFPQVWVQLSRLGHVAGSVGTAIPVSGPGDKSPRLFAFLLWDFGDGPLNRGW